MEENKNNLAEKLQLDQHIVNAGATFIEQESGEFCSGVYLAGRFGCECGEISDYHMVLNKERSYKFNKPFE